MSVVDKFETLANLPNNFEGNTVRMVIAYLTGNIDALRILVPGAFE